MDKFGYFTFVLGLAAGVLFTLLVNQSEHVISYRKTFLSGMIPVLWNPPEQTQPGKYERSYFYRLNGTQFELVETELSKRLEKENFDPRSQAELLYDEVKVLCQVYVDKGQLAKLGKAIQETWGSHCNKVVIVSGGVDRSLKDSYHIDIADKPNRVWEKSKQGFRQAYERYRNDYHYFLKADASMVVVVENLRYLLFVHNTSVPGYIGHVFLGKKDASSIVISRKGLEKLHPKLDECPNEVGGNDDASELTRCMEKVGIISSVDGRDYRGHLRFVMKQPDHKLPFNTATALSFTSLYWRFIKYPEQKDPECCYEYAILFSNVNHHTLYTLEHMVYHLRPYGVGEFKCSSEIGQK